MENKIDEIHQVNDKFFHKIFDSPVNTRDFLAHVLPPALKNKLDLAKIEIANTKYVSNQFKKGYSDIVVKTWLIGQKGKRKPVDIYFILEHKSEAKVDVLIQVLKYIVFELEKDYNHNKTPRIIIPVVFYHGASNWTIPLSFADQFDVDGEVKEFLLDFRYVLFDTNAWDFNDENNRALKENVFVFSAMALMKAAFKNDMETIRAILKFWDEKGFYENTELLMFFLVYIARSQELDYNQLQKMVEENKKNGGDLMQTLARQLEEKGRQEGIREGIREGVREGIRKGIKEGKLETAKQMLFDGLSVETIAKYTGLTEEEINILFH